jgi:murein DD-endopeptidase MepM/ murein hydrolase activator NlpD
MKICFFSFYFLSALAARGQLTNTEIRDLKNGSVKTDTGYVYQLPFARGSKFLLVQGYHGKMSHHNELSLDFKMRRGRKICAAREGTIISIHKNSGVGGLKAKYMYEGNHIMIRHTDGSTAMYWHLKKDGVLVNVGDSISKGQHIGYSGNTGYTAFPHLHFQVQDSLGRDVATRFITKKGIRYLRPARWYRSI